MENNKRHGCPHIATYFNMVLRVLDNAISQENKININTEEEEAKLFVENVTVYLENTIDSTFQKVLKSNEIVYEDSC